MNNKKIDYYIGLSYTVESIRDGDGFFMRVKELPGCISQGDTLEEAYSMIEDAKRSWIETAMEQDREIPLPENMTVNNYSGRILLRVPRSLHQKLIYEAETEGVSLNQYINFLISDRNKVTSDIFSKNRSDISKKIKIS